MAEEPQEKHLSKLVEESVSTLQEVDRRLQMVRADLASLISRAATLQAQTSAVAGAAPFSGAFALPSAGMPRPWGSLAPLAGPLGGGLQGALGSGPAPGVGVVPGLPATAGALPGAYGMGPAFGAPAGFGGLGGAGPRSTKEIQALPPVARVPCCDLVDRGEEYVVQIELPGVKKDDLDITVSDRLVQLNAQARPEVGEGTMLLTERGPVVYRRTIPFPAEVASTKSQAKFKDGILTLTVPKKVPEEGPRRVDVAYG